MAACEKSEASSAFREVRKPNPIKSENLQNFIKINVQIFVAIYAEFEYSLLGFSQIV